MAKIDSTKIVGNKHPAIAEVLALMQSMDDAGKWILVGHASELVRERPANKQATVISMSERRHRMTTIS